jgi:hypothetical protein
LKSILSESTERKLQTSPIKRTGNTTNRDIIAAIDQHNSSTPVQELGAAVVAKREDFSSRDVQD